MKGLGASSGYRPSYASSNKTYDPLHNLYNGSAQTMLKTRSSLMRAGAGGVANWAVFAGTSLSTGYVGAGTNTDPDLSYAAKMVQSLVNDNALGITHGGTGIRPACMVSGGTTSGWTYGGGWNVTNAAYPFTTNGGALTYVSPQAGTVVTVCVYNQSTNNIPWTIDGVAQANITTDGSATWKTVVVTGLSNAVHTIVLNPAVGTTCFCMDVSVTQTSGLIFHNLGMSGSRAASTNGTFGWTANTAVNGNMNAARWAALQQFLTQASGGQSLDVGFVELGINDDLAGVDYSTTISGVSAILAHPLLTNADVYLMPCWRATGSTDTSWNNYLRVSYQLADTARANGVNLIDINDRIGGHDTALANGILGPDGIHATAGGYASIGKSLADIFVA